MRNLPGPAPAWPSWTHWLFLAPALIVGGGVVVVLGGAFLGLAFGVGPEHTGGAVWAIFGLVLVLLMAVLIYFIGRRRGHSIASCRAAFYLFASPAFIFSLMVGWKAIERVMIR